jgi:hypothetical protein
MDSGGIGVGVGVGNCCTPLWLSESLVILPDDEDRGVTSDPQAASKTIKERNSRLHQIFFTRETFPD